MNRRKFVSSLAVGTAAAAVTRSTRLFAANPAADKPRPKVGVIGCGWYGGVNLESMGRNAQVEFVSLADPNAKALDTTRRLIAKHQASAPRTFADFRELLASRHHDIVIVATPDHWHAVPAIEAMKAGADVFLEKPISLDVIEGEALVAAARKYKRVVQVNTQRRSNPAFARARDEYVRSGKLGAVGLVETYSYLPGRPASLPPISAPPAHLDYEFWAGPAPKLPFRPLFESRGWRAFMEYGNGQIGDLGVHKIDLARWMLGLGWPQSVSSVGGIYVDKESEANITDTQRSTLHFPGFDMTWEHRTWGAPPIPARNWTDLWGARLIGKNGTLNLTMYGYEFTPAGGGPREGFHMLSKTGDLENVDFGAPAGNYHDVERHHMEDFMRARENRSRPIADVEEGHISTACCALANLALELGRPLAYDPKTRTIPGDAEATKRLAREYRAPWVHPDPAKV